MADLNAMSVPDVCEALGARAAAARLASIAREEDLVWAGAEGDVTSLALGGEGGTTRARVVCRENSMTAGVAVGATEVQLNLIASRFLGLPRE